MIEVNNISKSIDNHVILHDLSLHIPKGSIYGLIGPNGSGKTTVIKHLIGEYQQDQGSILYDDESIYENNVLKSKMAYLADDFFFPLNATISSMKSFYQTLYPTFDNDRFIEMMNAFHLNMKTPLRKYSKGMLKQAFFVLSLSHKPDYLIMDEPLDGLDPLARKTFWQYIIDDVYEREMSVLISSHNLKELEDKCDDIGIINQGTLVNEFNLDDLKTHVHKIQLAFNHDVSYEGLNILHQECHGKIDTLILNNKTEDINRIIKEKEPLLFEYLPLTLEELFIYELGGNIHD